jgi:hypothetical protein
MNNTEFNTLRFTDRSKITDIDRKGIYSLSVINTGTTNININEFILEPQAQFQFDTGNLGIKADIKLTIQPSVTAEQISFSVIETKVC